MRTLFAFILGISFGIIAALLYAPQNGKKTRKKLRKRARKLQLELEARAEQGVDRFNTWKHNAEEKLENTAKGLNGTETTHFMDA